MTGPPAAPARARALIDADPGQPLRFLLHRCSGVVHVRYPPDPDVMPEPVTAQNVVAVSVGLVRTLCGYQGATYPPGRARNVVVSTFDDAALCIRCHRVLGPVLRHRAFEHPQPEMAST